MKHLLILLLACTFSFPSRGQSIIQLSPLQGERGIQAAIEKASMCCGMRKLDPFLPQL